jgi:hypothetical protein
MNEPHCIRHETFQYHCRSCDDARAAAQSLPRALPHVDELTQLREIKPMKESNHYFLVRNSDTNNGTARYPAQGASNRFDTLKQAKAAAIEWAGKATQSQSYTVYEIRKLGTAGPIAPAVAWKAAK